MFHKIWYTRTSSSSLLQARKWWMLCFRSSVWHSLMLPNLVFIWPTFQFRPFQTCMLNLANICTHNRKETCSYFSLKTLSIKTHLQCNINFKWLFYIIQFIIMFLKFCSVPFITLFCAFIANRSLPSSLTKVSFCVLIF